MCLAVPAKIIELEGDFAYVDFGGVRRRVATALVPDAAAGDFVLVHAGMAIEVIDTAEAERTLALIREVFADLAEETDGPQARPQRAVQDLPE